MTRKPFYTIKEFAEIVQKHPNTVSKWIGKKIIDSIKIERSVLIPDSEVDKLERYKR